MIIVPFGFAASPFRSVTWTPRTGIVLVGSKLVGVPFAPFGDGGSDGSSLTARLPFARFGDGG
jgi:hypothetical protein